MSERLRTRRKANIASTNRLDNFVNNFVDNNNTHILAVAHFVTSEKGVKGDDEYWGLEVIDPALKSGEQVLPEEFLTETLSRTLIHA